MRLTLEDDFRDVFRMFFNKLRRLIRSRQNENLAPSKYSIREDAVKRHFSGWAPQ